MEGLEGEPQMISASLFVAQILDSARERASLPALVPETEHAAAAYAKYDENHSGGGRDSAHEGGAAERSRWCRMEMDPNLVSLDRPLGVGELRMTPLRSMRITAKAR